MKITIISDTHGGQEALGDLSGDVLIHCGDVETLFQRNPGAIAAMDDWFGRQRFAHILCVGGNHDRAIERGLKSGRAPFRNATFLHDTETVIDGVKFYGTSWIPVLAGHAFFADSDALALAWSRIPDDVDVLITHTPPAEVLDRSSRDETLGCPLLADRLAALQPKLHCFGHVHASRGCRVVGKTTYVNATSVNSSLQMAYPPFEFDLTKTRLKRRRLGWRRLFGG